MSSRIGGFGTTESLGDTGQPVQGRHGTRQCPHRKMPFAPEELTLFDRFDNLPDRGTNPLGRQTRHDHADAAAFQAGRPRGGRQGLLDTQADFFQQGIADLMAAGVVHNTKRNDVDQGHPVPCRALRVGEHGTEVLFEGPTVAEIGQ